MHVGIPNKLGIARVMGLASTKDGQQGTCSAIYRAADDYLLEYKYRQMNKRR